MTIPLGVLWSIVIALLAFIFGVFGFLWKISINSARTNEEVIDTTNKKVKRVYERFDENKEKNKKAFVEKDTCQLINEHNKENFQRIEMNIQNGFNNLTTQMASLSKQIMGWMRKNGGD